MNLRLSVALILALLAALSAVPSASAATPRAPREFLGLVTDELLHSDPFYRASTLDRQRDIKVGTMRQVFFWKDIERSPGVYDLEAYDRLVLDAAARNIKMLPVLLDPPAWASRGPESQAGRTVYPPRNNAHLAGFAQALVRRYGPNGTLWAENPGAFKVPIRNWQVWNEPNLRGYWGGRPSARSYVSMLRTVGGAIKRADRRAQIVTAGLPNSRSNGSVKLEKYVADMYSSRGAKYFDVLAVHPYDREGRDVVAKVRSIRRLMNSRRDSRAGLWVTEFGWASGGPRHPFRVGEARQAREIKTAVSAFARERSRLRLRGVVLYNWRDFEPNEFRPDFWGIHTGLLRSDLSPKPAYQSFRSAVRAAVR